jgi:hypothetical protein
MHDPDPNQRITLEASALTLEPTSGRDFEVASAAEKLSS